MSGGDSIETVLRWRGAASFGWLVVLLAWESIRPARHWAAGWRDRGRHAVVNVALALGNVLMVALLFAWIWRWVAMESAARGLGLLHQAALPSWAHALAAILLLDAWTYAWHRICHRVPFLWRFHRVHHSDARMDVTTGNRFHAVEIALSAVLRIPLIPLLGIRFGDLVLYETLLQFVVQWQHANLVLPRRWERVLRWFVVTPGMHQVHHSRAPSETDSNYASILPVWDRLCRTLQLREHPERVDLGLDGEDVPGRQTIRGLMRRPFRP
ncbi:MAG: sterol desaturase family protein [Verrucomicrobiae bacterium]|nr:sterol desaturase family protein [Verrucomicrobiae bacterium]